MIDDRKSADGPENAAAAESAPEEKQTEKKQTSPRSPQRFNRLTLLASVLVGVLLVSITKGRA